MLAVGLVADDMPLWMRAFGDIDGWNLQHVRRVRWLRNTAKEFPSKPLGGQVRTFASANVKAVKDWVAFLTADEADVSRDLAKPGRNNTRFFPNHVFGPHVGSAWVLHCSRFTWDSFLRTRNEPIWLPS